MNNEPEVLTQGDIIGILQDANSVSLGQPIFNSSEEYNKLKAIIESAIRYTNPVKEYKEPSVKEIEDLWLDVVNNIPANDHRPREWHFARTILRKAQEK